MELWVWVVLAVVLAVAELLTVTLVLAMLSVGAFAAALVAGLGGPLWLQLVVCALVSSLCLFGLRPLLRRHRSGVPRRVSRIGVESLVGSVATVVVPVDRGAGQVRIDGELWSARAAVAGGRYGAGQRVRVLGVDGATVEVGAEEGEQ